MLLLTQNEDHNYDSWLRGTVECRFSDSGGLCAQSDGRSWNPHPTRVYVNGRANGGYHPTDRPTDRPTIRLPTCLPACLTAEPSPHVVHPNKHYTRWCSFRRKRNPTTRQTMLPKGAASETRLCPARYSLQRNKAEPLNWAEKSRGISAFGK